MHLMKSFFKFRLIDQVFWFLIVWAFIVIVLDSILKHESAIFVISLR